METYSPEDILIDNLSFKLNKGSSYITDRRSVSFWAQGSNIYKVDSGNRVIKIQLNAEEGAWLDPQSVMMFFTVENGDKAFDRKLRPISNPYSFFRRFRLLMGNTVIEDFDNFNRVSHMFSKLMNDGARDNEDAIGFGYRYDDYETKVRLYDIDINNGVIAGTGTDPATRDEVNAQLAGLTANGNFGTKYDAVNIKGFNNKMTVGFKPLCGLFSQFKYIPLKYAPITLELELVNSMTEPIIIQTGTGTNAGDFPDGLVAQPQNTSNKWEINNVHLTCDICHLDNNLNNAYVEHLLGGKALPITMTTFITQQQTVAGYSQLDIQVIRSASKLVGLFITFNKDPVDAVGANEYFHKEFTRFYHPMVNNNEDVNGFYNPDYDLEFSIQLGSKLYPEYPCKSITEGFYHLRKALNLPTFHQHSISSQWLEYKESEFIFGFNLEKVPDSSYTGINTRAGQQMLVKVKPLNQGVLTSALMPDRIYITLLSEQIVSIKDSGIELLD